MLIKNKKTLFTLFCLLLLYISWGSTFIANKFALEYFPGLLLGAYRMILGAVVLFIYTLFKGEKISMDWQSFKKYNVLAFLLAFCASSLLSKGQEGVSSGVAAVLYGTAPIWMILGGWLIWKEKRPSLKQFMGLALGFIGVIWLSLEEAGGHGAGSSSGESSFLGMMLILLAALGWVWGSFISKNDNAKANTENTMNDCPKNKDSMVRSTAILMFFGGVQTFIFSCLVGEQMDYNNLTLDAFLPLLYLVFVSSITGYISYLWILYNVGPIVAISYEYINPVFAVFLGWLIGGESVSVSMVLACFALIVSVILTTKN